MVFVNSKSLSSLKIDDTPVDDPSLKVLVANNSDTLKLLKMSSCPHVSPAGTGRESCSTTIAYEYGKLFYWLFNYLKQNNFLIHTIFSHINNTL